MQNKLPGLNGLRAMAASLVLIGHVLQFAGYMGSKYAAFLFEEGFLRGKWLDMVNLFFVISGFIITLLLLQEKERTNTVSLKGFYIRRFLRIWPLYFFILAVVWVICKTTDIYSPFGVLNTTSIIVFTLFLVTLNPFIGAPLSVLPHYWSLSVEEQYYLFVPILVRRFNVIPLSVTTIVLMLLLRNGSAFLSHTHPFFSNLSEYLVASKFSSMAIGAIGACWYKQQAGIIRFINRHWCRLIIWAAFAGSFFVRFFIPYINSEVQALLYLFMVLTSIEGAAYFLLNNRFMELAGQISYGIYMYHVPLIPLIYYSMQKMGLLDLFMHFYCIPFILLCFVVTFGIAWCSYFFFEKKMLAFKGSLYRIFRVR